MFDYTSVSEDLHSRRICLNVNFLVLSENDEFRQLINDRMMAGFDTRKIRRDNMGQ